MIEDASGPIQSSRPLAGWPLAVVGVGLALILVGAAVWLFGSGVAGGSQLKTARVGAAAPEIVLPQLQAGHVGAPQTLSALRGRPVVVNFWATWCGPCRDELPAFQAKYLQYRDTQQLVVVGVDAQGDGGPDQVQEFVSQTGVTYPIWLTQDESVESAYRIDALPSTVFVDRRGVIQDIVIGGPMKADYLQKELEKIF